MNISLTTREANSFLAVLQALNGEESFQIARVRAGRDLLELFGADHFASYCWDEESRSFEQPVFVNMSMDNLQRYDKYFQFHDPITRPMQRMRRAVSVNEIMDQPSLLRTEFYNDFLRCDQLYYGINLHVYCGDIPLADWRIWRSNKRDNFDKRSLQILDMLAPHLRNATRIAQLSKHNPTQMCVAVSPNAICESTTLSQRESQIAYHAILGQSDSMIAETLFLSLATVRSHLRHIYKKLDVKNRSSLCRRLLGR